MPEACYDPVRRNYHGWKKRLVGPIERWSLRRCKKLVATCEAEKKWIQAYVGKECPDVVVEDIKRFFDLKEKEEGRKEKGEGIGTRLSFRERAERKIEEWLEDVTRESFDRALERLLAEKRADGDYKFRNESEIALAIAGAKNFFADYSRMVVELSDGRCVYFAPDRRSRERNGGDLARCWAEYAYHAVSNGGPLIPGKGYHERWYNPYKMSNLDLIVGTLKAEACVPVLKKNPSLDAVKFFGETHQYGTFDVVTRLDEYGNVEANMTEITFEASSRKIKPPRLVPLAEAVRTVVYHQTTAGSYPPNGHMIPNPQMPRKGLHLLYLGRRHLLKGVEFLERAVTELNHHCTPTPTTYASFSLRIVSDHFGDELEKDWAWCDVLVLPTLSDNFGLVVAEALEHGRRVITTDGAPAWEGQPGVVYLKGYRDGTAADRVQLLKDALKSINSGK